MMNTKLFDRRRSLRARRGAAFVMVAVMLVVIVGMCAFATEMGRMFLLRSQVQNAVDAGALAATLRLQQNSEAVDLAAASAEEFVQVNRAGSLITIPEDAITVELGEWDSDTKVFSVGGENPNAVNVFARQDNEPFFFGRIFGRTSFGAPASAIASGSVRPMDIMMVLDLSGSMAWYGRIEALRNAAPTFVDVIEKMGGDDQIGMMGLSANPDGYDPEAEGHSGSLYESGLHATANHNVGVLESPLTTDFDTLRSSTLSSGNLEAGKYTNYTGTGAALGDATHCLVNSVESRTEAKRIIVLLSDGEANRPSGDGAGYALEMAAYAAGNDTVVYTISLGDSADLNLMQGIADATEGLHFDATGSGESELTSVLTDAFKQIGGAIKRSRLVQ